jgi:hypothetical protein
MVKKIPETLVCFSYFPLLRGTPGQTISIDGEADAKKLLEETLAKCHSGQAHACLWAMFDGVPTPVLVYEGAHEIADHLVEWAEGKPDEWFRIHFRERDGRYAIAIQPDLDRSIWRFRTAYFIAQGELLPPNVSIKVMFQPLTFISGVEHCFGRVRDQLPRHLRVGFLNRHDLDDKNPASIDDSTIKLVGPFEVARESAEMAPMLDDLLDQRG